MRCLLFFDLYISFFFRGREAHRSLVGGQFFKNFDFFGGRALKESLWCKMDTYSLSQVFLSFIEG